MPRALPWEPGALRGAVERWLRPGLGGEREACKWARPFARINYRIVIKSVIIKLQKQKSYGEL